jgi:histone acetyltransferase (RNA polymerase elongator complex component)
MVNRGVRRPEREFDIDIFVNCSWVDTRWQYTFTHKQYIEHQINNKTTRITNKTTQITNLEECWPCPEEECWPCPVFANYTLAFALQLREKHGKTSVRVAKESQGSQIFPIFGKLLHLVPILGMCECFMYTVGLGENAK